MLDAAGPHSKTEAAMTPKPTPPAKPGFVLCLTYHLPNISGLTLSAHEIARHLAHLGHPVRVVAGRVPETSPARESADGIEVFRVRSWFRLGKALVMPGYWLALWRAVDGMAVVNVHLPSMDAATVAIVAKLRGKRLIVSHISSMSKATRADRIMRAIAAGPHLVAGFLADRVQVVSDDYADASTFCRLFRRKVVSAPLPIYLQLFPDEAHPPRAPRVATAERPYRIGYVGRIARQKSLGLLLEALPDIARAVGGHVEIVLLGPASEVIGETYWKDILDKATASGGAVRYCGVKIGRDLAEFYASLDVMVLPSMDRLESFGLVQVEAMLRGVAVVASDLPGMRVPIARTGMGRLFTPGNANSLAEAISDVLLNGPPATMDSAQIEARFGNEVACAPYVDLLNQTMQTGARARA
jgi:glycosyltransferase involved in cell wall biosynthesis